MVSVAGHAWLEGDGEVYDPVDHVTMPVVQYIAERGAVAERRYTLKEVSSLLMGPEKIDHAGPWHESAGITKWSRRR